jgi:copper oxidase (laccase) domain-containing protein
MPVEQYSPSPLSPEFSRQKDAVDFRKDIVYLKQDEIARFPIFESEPVYALFSWGKNAPNYSETYEADPLVARERTRTFLRESGLALPPRTVHIFPGAKDSAEILEVTEDMIDAFAPSQLTRPEDEREALQTKANFVVTKDPGISMILKPADCWSAVVSSVDGEGRPLVGLAHWGRAEQESLQPTKAMLYLESLGCARENIKIGIMPGIKKDQYFIKAAELGILLPRADRWGRNLELKTPDGEERVYLDLEGYLLQQLQNFVPPKNIQIFDIDSYKAAQAGVGFSHRRFTSTKDTPEVRGAQEKQVNGRHIIAAQLKG